MKLINSQFSNPHGLADKANRSTAADISKLAFHALKNPLFKEIVDLKTYKTNSIMEINMKHGQAKLVDYSW